jgi:CheY-like chemotaxis protein
MTLSIDPNLPAPTTTPSRRVVIVDPDSRATALLVPYLESRGWSVQAVDSARRAIRQWGTVLGAPLLVVKLEDDHPDTFELLAALAARAIHARVVVVGRLPYEDARMLAVERVLEAPYRFSDLAAVLEELDGHAFAVREVS